jgi:hypothetical protein
MMRNGSARKMTAISIEQPDGGVKFVAPRTLIPAQDWCALR